MRLNEAAQRYLGNKELSGNVFKDDNELGKKLHAAGQKDGDPWCALFVEVCLKDSDPDNVGIYDRLCSASAVQTFKNFSGAKFKILLVPEPDTIVIFQQYKDGVAQWQGHAGIVSEVLDGGRAYRSIEGNTNASGGREGIEVAEKTRSVNYSTTNGLRLVGFIKV
jgi:hypothetical protein